MWPMFIVRVVWFRIVLVVVGWMEWFLVRGNMDCMVGGMVQDEHHVLLPKSE